MRSLVLHLLLFFVKLPVISGQQDVFKTTVVTSKKTFKCIFVMILDGKSVNLKKSKMSCAPVKPKVQKVNLKIDGELGSYNLSISINPNKIKKAEFIPKTSTCDYGYARVCPPNSSDGCGEGMFKYCANIEDNALDQSETGPNCSCLPGYLVTQAVSSGENPLGCGKGCVCLSEDFRQCENKTIAASSTTVSTTTSSTTTSSTTTSSTTSASTGKIKARASSELHPRMGAEKAVDGQISEAHQQLIFHSKTEDYPWLELSFPEEYVSGLEFVPRFDCCAERVRDLEIRAGNSTVPSEFTGRLTLNTKVAKFDGPAGFGQMHHSIKINFERRILAKYVTIQKIGKGVSLECSEVIML